MTCDFNVWWCASAWIWGGFMAWMLLGAIIIFALIGLREVMDDPDVFDNPLVYVVWPVIAAVMVVEMMRR